jgi:hypothetical protein
MIGAAALAIGCGSAGSGSVGSFGGTGTPASGSQPPSNGSTVPGNPNQPQNASTTPGGAGVCSTACALAAKYPCVVMDLPAGDCVMQCETALANGGLGASLDCVKASLVMFKCADAQGGVSCPADGGDPQFTDAATAACSQYVQATVDACGNDQQQGGSCDPSIGCDGCQNDCDKCKCQTGGGASCDSVCGTPNNNTCTLSGDQCVGCADACSQCTCLAGGDPTNCTTQCAG